MALIKKIVNDLKIGLKSLKIDKKNIDQREVKSNCFDLGILPFASFKLF